MLLNKEEEYVSFKEREEGKKEGREGRKERERKEGERRKKPGRTGKFHVIETNFFNLIKDPQE